MVIVAAVLIGSVGAWYLHAARDQPTVIVTGTVQCDSGSKVVGVFVGAGPTRSGFATFAPNGADSSVTYIYSAPVGVPYAVHVGCGGTPAHWTTENWSEHYPGTSNSFVCHDRANAQAHLPFGQCSHAG